MFSNDIIIGIARMITKKKKRKKLSGSLTGINPTLNECQEDNVSQGHA